jgi:uncharacterized protein (DUF1499 family)
LIPAPRVITAVILVMPLFSCAGTRPANLGVKDSHLAPCPMSPNCVSSDDADPAHRITPLELAVPAGEAWRAVRSAVAGLARTNIVTETDDYLHAECSSAFFGFVDDLELHLRTADHLIAVRSAARLGHGDFGVNRKRVENLRSSLRRQGIIR